MRHAYTCTYYTLVKNYTRFPAVSRDHRKPHLHPKNWANEQAGPLVICGSMLNSKFQSQSLVTWWIFLPLHEAEDVLQYLEKGQRDHPEMSLQSQ